jgi:hypothetical protein
MNILSKHRELSKQINIHEMAENLHQIPSFFFFFFFKKIKIKLFYERGILVIFASSVTI